MLIKIYNKIYIFFLYNIFVDNNYIIIIILIIFFDDLSKLFLSRKFFAFTLIVDITCNPFFDKILRRDIEEY